jgi:hypothetical protein
MLILRSLLQRHRFSRVSQGEDSLLLRAVSAEGGLLYSTHRYNFIRVRHGDHSFLRGDAQFLADSSGFLRRGLDFSQTMV